MKGDFVNHKIETIGFVLVASVPVDVKTEKRKVLFRANISPRFAQGLIDGDDKILSAARGEIRGTVRVLCNQRKINHWRILWPVKASIIERGRIPYVVKELTIHEHD